MRVLKIVVMLAGLLAFGAGMAAAKSQMNHSGTYTLKTAESTGSLKLAKVKGDMYQFSIVVYKKDGSTCNLDGMIDLPDGVGVYRDSLQMCDFSMYFEKGKAMIDSGKKCSQCGGKAFIDGAYARGMKK